MPPSRRRPDDDRETTILRLLRTEDLIDLSLTFRGVTISTEEGGARMLTTGDDGGSLVVTLPPQHVFEEAFAEGPGVPDPTGTAELRIAEPSRLVYDLPAKLAVPLDAAEVLALITRIPLRTAPLATPVPSRPGPIDWWWPPFRPVDVGEAVDRIRAERRALVARVLDADPGAELSVRLTGYAAQVLGAARGSRRIRYRLPEGLGLTDRPDLRGPVVRRGQPRQPGPLETAIEAPYRLIVSPSSDYGAFRHATEPVRAPSDADRTELWRTTLTSRVVSEDGELLGHDDSGHQRIVRAVWARDLEDSPDPPAFRGSLDAKGRRAIVRMSAQSNEGVTPQPLLVRRLALSSLGAWIDWRADWGETWEQYPDVDKPEYARLESYVHQAAMGRDTYVRITEPGFLFPFGHRAVWVTLTERKITTDGSAVAYLRQRNFIVLRERTRDYTGFRDTPLQSVTLAPTITPDLDRPAGMPENEITLTTLFVPSREGVPFAWDIDAVDAAGDPVSLSAPLLFVAADVLGGVTDSAVSGAYNPVQPIPARGQSVSLAPPATPGDTAFEVSTFRFDGEIDRVGIRSRPYLVSADAVVPAMRLMAPASPTVAVSYTATYLAEGFAAGNPAQVFLGLTTEAPVDFSDGSDRAGGFIEPSMDVRGLSRSMGAVGDAGTGAAGFSQGEFDPETFLAGAMPKLFGLFSLLEILDVAGIDLELAPSFVTEALDAVSSLAAEAQRLEEALDGGAQRLAADLGSAAHQGAQAIVQQALDQLEAAAAPMQAALAQLLAELAALVGDPSHAQGALDALDDVVARLQAVLDAAANPALPAAVRATIERPATALRAIVDDPALDLLQTLEDFADDLLSPSGSVTARYEWRPQIASWPDQGDKAVFLAKDPHGLSIGVEVRASASGAPSADVVAELRSFALQLLPKEPLMRMNFSRIGFRVGTGRKPEVDVVFDGMEFLGVLGFIDTLRRMIPFDGFADPPYVDITPAGVTAGFDVALPNVSVGVFSLENVSLGADARVPFLGDAVTVGFYFCRKDSPFRLTVLCIGGGGWVGLRASPAGLVELEMGLEAAAALSIDLGVASGSVSISVGVYLRLEGDAGSLTAYFRIRGEVDVLGLISASITLELSLSYDFPTGKLIGRASVVVEVEVLFFSASVEVSCERKLAGSKGDPTMQDIMPPGAGGEQMWAEYCEAFAGV